MSAVPARAPRGRFAVGLGEAAGAIADLGIFVPLATALILVNGLDATSVLVCAGLLVIASGAYFKIPFPVQPLKALTAVAVAGQLAPEVIHAAGLEIAAFLLLLSIRHVADAVARIFTKPVVRSLQLGVGALLLITSYKLIDNPPEVFVSTPETPWPWILMLATFAGVVVSARTKHYWLALVILGGGAAVVVLTASPHLSGPGFSLPVIAVPGLHSFSAAFFLLVVPQLPLTFGNAVVATNDLAHEYFGDAAEGVTPGRVCLSSGIGNAVSGLLGGMPMCHGAGGLTAHSRLGARTAGMNLILGSVLLALGLFFGSQVPVLLGLLPVWALGGFLVYAGLRHAWLASDLRGAHLVIAIVSAGLGAWFGNLAITAAVALVATHSIDHAAKSRPAGTLSR